MKGTRYFGTRCFHWAEHAGSSNIMYVTIDPSPWSNSSNWSAVESAPQCSITRTWVILMRWSHKAVGPAGIYALLWTHSRTLASGVSMVNLYSVIFCSTDFIMSRVSYSSGCRESGTDCKSFDSDKRFIDFSFPLYPLIQRDMMYANIFFSTGMCVLRCMNQLIKRSYPRTFKTWRPAIEGSRAVGWNHKSSFRLSVMITDYSSQSKRWACFLKHWMMVNASLLYVVQCSGGLDSDLLTNLICSPTCSSKPFHRIYAGIFVTATAQCWSFTSIWRQRVFSESVWDVLIDYINWGRIS